MVIGVSAGATPAAAQSGSRTPANEVTEAQRNEARSLFREGVRALDEQRFAEAAELLARSLELRDSPTARYNRALALRGAGRYLEALAETERYLELASGPRHQRLRPRVEEMRVELRESLGELVLAVDGQAQQLLLNGTERPVPSDSLRIPMDPGPLDIEVRRDGFAPQRLHLTIEAGRTHQASIDAAAEPLPAFLQVHAAPEEAQILQDGEQVGVGEVRLELHPPEQGIAVNLSVRADGFESQDRQLRMVPGQEAELRIALSEVAPTPLRKKWWFWTLVVAGAGAVAAGIAIAAQPPSQTVPDVDSMVQVLR